jgi:hypothetical protein
MVQTDEAGQPIRDAAKRVVPLVDYPFAQDGLDIWYAMQDWFGRYLAIYYPSNAQVHTAEIKQCFPFLFPWNMARPHFWKFLNVAG